MLISVGTGRIVVPIKPLGVALKFPRIKFFLACHMVFYTLVRPPSQILRAISAQFRFKSTQRATIKGALFGGLVENWGEYRFYTKTKNQFLQPTYFSFLGLVNIQKFGYPIPTEYDGVVWREKIWSRLVRITDREVLKDPHHFEGPDNLCRDGCRVRICDYGSQQTQTLITKFGERMYKEIVL